MEDDRLRIGLIGCGHMGSYYAHNIAKNPDVEITICCDPSPEKLERFREKWNISNSTTDWTEVISFKPDGIINCTLDSKHAEIFKYCLESGIPVLTEKPAAFPLTLIEQVLADKHQYKDCLQSFVINFSKRSIAPVAEAFRMLSGGTIGRLQRIELNYRQGWLVNHDFGDWREKSAWFWRLTEHYSNHGVLGDLGSHLLDLACLFGGLPRDVSCATEVYQKEPAELRGYELNSPDEASCVIHFQDGVFCVLNATRAAAGEKDYLGILLSGTDGSMKIEPESDKSGLYLYKRGDEDWQRTQCSERAVRNHEYFFKILSAPADERREDKSAILPGFAEAVFNQVLIEACSESAEKQRTIVLKDYISDKAEISKLWRTRITE